MMTTPAIEPTSSRNAASGISKRRLLLVDDHPIVCQGLSEMINYEADLAVCGVAADRHQALEKIDKLQPDLIVLDISLKASNGIELLKDVKSRHPKLGVLMLSMHDENLYAFRALRAGAAGYIMKQEPADRVLAAIRQALSGEVALSPSLEKWAMKQLVGGSAAPSGLPLEDLTDRELEVFRLIANGYTTRQIAAELHLSVKTIESHRAHLKLKLNLETSAELVQRAIQQQEFLGRRPPADGAAASPALV